ncbi:hypothetical protein FB384_004950 [Prauserella sediminis]|uniref:Uncharacterized protein n=1 Tax=Prauserella sediminis TaxID=577680 RepID=A0A839XTF8_9PSEU|nr:hypothetical protein [Prauserella sediminis]
MSPMHRADVCRRCGRRFTNHHRHHGRGLDNACWTAAVARGELDQYPQVRRRIDPDELDKLESQQLDTATIALRLGFTTTAIRQRRSRRRRASQ